MSSSPRYSKSKSFSSSKPAKKVSAEEVSKLFKNGSTDYEVLANLRAKHGDKRTVDAVFDAYKERQDLILRKARKFKQLIYDRYSRYNLTFPQLLTKARKYKKKYNLSDAEFHVFLTSSLSERAYGSAATMVPNTTMSKTLGYGATIATADRLNVGENEMDVLQEILKLYGETKTLHSQVVLQSLTYEDCSAEAISGDYNKEFKNLYSYVHPIVAALFLPRINILDEHMIIANLANIIKCKHEGKPIVTKPEFELYWSLITDPNNTAVCDMDSPLRDLKNRIVLQTRLWDSVLNLRQGKYYNDNLSQFLSAVDNCRNNIYDAPDLAYVKDEGTVLRRLLAAFSMRPTVISTTPLYGIASSNPHISAAAVTQITSIPMMSLRLPVNAQHTNQAVQLDDARNQAEWFIENKMLVPRNRSIMYSRDVLFFYVGRRYQTINVGRLHAPFNFSSLPMTSTGYEALNDMTVNFDYNITISDDQFELRSVVLIEKSASRGKLIIGSTTAIRMPRDVENGNYDETFLLYDPQGAGIEIDTSSGRKRNKPVTWIPGETPFNNNGPVESFYDSASTRGTIFVYVKVNEGTTNSSYLR
jgi:hypothetical protein